MQGSITLAGYTFTADEWSKVKAELCDMDRPGNDQLDARPTKPDPVNDNAASSANARS